MTGHISVHTVCFVFPSLIRYDPIATDYFTLCDTTKDTGCDCCWPRVFPICCNICHPEEFWIRLSGYSFYSRSFRRYSPDCLSFSDFLRFRAQLWYSWQRALGYFWCFQVMATLSWRFYLSYWCCYWPQESAKYHISVPKKAQKMAVKSHIKQFDLTSKDIQLRNAIQKWWQEKAISKFWHTTIQTLGVRIFMSDQVINCIIGCAHYNKISTVDHLLKETNWTKERISEYGEDIHHLSINTTHLLLTWWKQYLLLANVHQSGAAHAKNLVTIVC